MRTISLVLCDNDFGACLRHSLESAYKFITWHDRKLTKEQVEHIIRKGIEFHYLAYHNFPAWAVEKPRLNQTLKYLSKIQILFDEEAEKHIETHDHDGGSYYLLLETGEIESY